MATPLSFLLPGTTIPSAPTLSNDTQDIVSQCKVVIYDWTTRGLTLNSGRDSDLTKTSALDVSSQILSFNYSKSMGGPTGTFSFTLSNSPDYGSGDWKDIIKRGTWCVIYMSREGELVLNPKVGVPDPNSKKLQEAKKIRCIGFIDRVAVKAEMSERGAFDVTYEVSGRDFGVVYEDTSIWHNVFRFERIMLDAIATSQLNITGTVTVDKAVSLIHDLFFNPKSVPGAKVNSEHSLVSTALQWLMPRQMLNDIGLNVGTSPFWGEIPHVKNFSKTEANLAIEKPTDYLSGNAWEMLKKLSVPQFHELFTETDDSTGLPSLTFRPIPWALNKAKYPTVGKRIKLYKDLPTVTLSAIDVVDFHLGEDNHARYNSFLATVSTSLINVEDNISLLDGSGFPKNVQDSIKRYGFRPMHVTVDAIVKNAEKSNGKSNSKILIEFNEVLYDYWNNAVFAESGEISAVGQNAVKIGKCLVFDEKTPYAFGKRYYIEGYTDSYSVDEKGAGYWGQTISVTRGFQESSLASGTDFGERDDAFTHEGEFTPSGMASGKQNKK
jgi:hypothetical protein